MKKEHWLYVVIAILAIWIIASYVKKPSSNDVTDDTTLSGEEGAGDYNDTATNGVSNTMPVPGTDTKETEVVGEGGVSTGVVADVNLVGTPAGPNKGTLTANTATTNEIVVNNQAASDMVQIAKVAMAQNGWVVIHTDLEGKPANIWGAQRFDVGAYSGGQVELLHSMIAGNTYYAMIHSDNGDKVFDRTTDTPVAGADGQMVMVKFVAQ
ncbi:MAG TPA: hypothetical protein VI953_01915 [Candidatus Paceibacterota bacterium]